MINEDDLLAVYCIKAKKSPRFSWTQYGGLTLWRIAHGLTQSQLALLLNMDPGALSNKLNHKHKHVLSSDDIRCITRLTGLSLYGMIKATDVSETLGVGPDWEERVIKITRTIPSKLRSHRRNPAPEYRELVDLMETFHLTYADIARLFGWNRYRLHNVMDANKHVSATDSEKTALEELKVFLKEEHITVFGSRVKEGAAI